MAAEPFVASGEPLEACGPSKAALGDPSVGQQSEAAFFLLWFLTTATNAGASGPFLSGFSAPQVS